VALVIEAQQQQPQQQQQQHAGQQQQQREQQQQTRRQQVQAGQQQQPESVTMWPEHDAKRVYTSMQQHANAATIALSALLQQEGGMAVPSDPANSALRGYSPLLQFLWYADFNSLWIVPFCHSFYLGVLKDFFTAITATEAKAGEVCCVALCMWHLAVAWSPVCTCTAMMLIWHTAC
jgi:hypothetical protein